MGGAAGGDDEDITQQLKGLSLYPQDEDVGDSPLNVLVLNSVECRNRYLKFICDAAAKANRHPDMVTLCIANAPNLSVDTFEEVLKAIGDPDIYRRVCFFCAEVPSTAHCRPVLGLETISVNTLLIQRLVFSCLQQNIFIRNGLPTP